MKAQAGIYAIINYHRGVHYIGSAVNLAKRWREHRYKLRRGMHENAKLQNSWNKYGEAKFYFEVIETIADPTKLLAAEQRWLDLSSRNIALNICFTARHTLGFRHSEETKRRYSELRRGKPKLPCSEEHRRNISIAKTGRKLPPQSPEDRAKKSAAMRGNKNALGCVRSAETRARMALAQKARFANAS